MVCGSWFGSWFLVIDADVLRAICDSGEVTTDQELTPIPEHAMSTEKSTVDQIRQRFDNDVERFSNLETGQSAAIDAPLVLQLISAAAAAVTPQAKSVLDVGCGAGNYTLKLLERLPNLDVTLIDLSLPMLERAVQRVASQTSGSIETIQNDIRQIDLGSERFDVILASAVLHHLRTDAEWQQAFANFHRALRPGGSLWIFDLVEQDTDGVRQIVWQQYGEYLTSLKDAAYRDHVFDYIQREDTPRSLTFQINLLQTVGFSRVDVLHKHACFAAFGAVK
jgi:tRNA (cmo5U34)-methyltransferase